MRSQILAFALLLISCGKSEQDRTPVHAATAEKASPVKPAPNTEVNFPRTIFHDYLLKDLAFFESKFGIASETIADNWGQFGGLPHKLYEINGCHYELIERGGRIISMGVLLAPDQGCDIAVERAIFGVDMASTIDIKNRDQFGGAERYFLRQCLNTDGICAKYDADGVIIAEPAETFVRKALGAEVMPDISLEGGWTVDHDTYELDKADENKSLYPGLYRESYGLY